MNRLGYAVWIGAGLASGAVALAAPASASVPGVGSSADDAVNTLKGQGYSVQLSATPSSPLSQCTVAGIKTLSDSGGAVDASSVAYVDVSCPTGC